MTRFAAWFRWEWRDHWKLVAGCALGTVFIAWVALLLGHSGMGRANLEGVLVGSLAVVALVLAAGLFGSERRYGADALLLRTPGARLPLFLARLAFFATAMGAIALVGAFGSARVAQFEKIPRTSLQAPELGLFLWPRYIAGDLLVLAFALAAVGLLASAWTRRGTVAFVLGLLLPAAILFPWIYLGASRGDFFPFTRLGAIALAAWPLLLLALAALGVSWFFGRRFLNRPWRAVAYGLLVLVVGTGIAGAWTAHALAEFDRVRADGAGFRMTNYVVGPYVPQYVRNPGRRRFQPLDSVALSPDGNAVWFQAFRHDAGRWPSPTGGSYGADARDFREDRGTWSRQWRIDLESGKARSVGEIREGLGWTDLGSGRHHGLLRGVDRTASMGCRSFALLVRAGHSEEARIVDLSTGAILADANARDRARGVAASATGVRDAEGRPAWLESERQTEGVGTATEGLPRIFVVTAAGRTPVDDETVRRLHHPLGALAGWSALAVPGGWAHQFDASRFLTIDATTGRVRRSPAELTDALAGYAGEVFYLDTRYVVTVTERRRRRGAPSHYAVLDLETGTLGPKLEAPAGQFILPTATAGGQLLCLSRTEAGRAFVLWAPKTDKRTPLTIEGDSAVVSEVSYPQLQGADVRGNMVFRVVTGFRGPEGCLTMRTLYFRAKTRQLFALDKQQSVRVRQGTFQAIGIDAQDRVVGLSDHDGNGYRSIVRFDPVDGSTSVVFPKTK